MIPDILSPLLKREIVFPTTQTKAGGDHWRSADSGGDRKLVLLYGFLHPGTQSGFLEGLEKRLLGAVVLHRCLLRLMVTAGPYGADAQGWRQLQETKDSVVFKSPKKKMYCNKTRKASSKPTEIAIYR